MPPGDESFPKVKSPTSGIDQKKSGQARKVPGAGQEEKEGGPNAIPIIIGVDVGVMIIAAVIAAVICRSMTHQKHAV
jgi:hypothetical protein